MFKKRIGITQRVMKHPRYEETMDCLDVQWAQLLTSLGAIPIPMALTSPNHIPDMWQALNLDGLILSGGNTLADYADNTDDPASISPQRDLYEKHLLDTALSDQTPILGVCRGLQIINIHFGGRLIKIKGHAGTKHTVHSKLPDDIFVCPKNVNSFHDCAVPPDGLGTNLKPLAFDSAGNIEAFKHMDNKILAIMWHPEREKPWLNNDCDLIRGHFEL